LSKLFIMTKMLQKCCYVSEKIVKFTSLEKLYIYIVLFTVRTYTDTIQVFLWWVYHIRWIFGGNLIWWINHLWVIGGFYIGKCYCISRALSNKKENLGVFNLADFCNSPNCQNKLHSKFSSYTVLTIIVVVVKWHC